MTPIPPATKAFSIATHRSDRAPANSPNVVILALTADCSMSPWGVSAAFTIVSPPRTCWRPIRLNRVSIGLTPFSIGRIAVPGPTAGAIAAMGKPSGSGGTHEERHVGTH